MMINPVHLQILIQIFKHKVYLLIHMDNIKKLDNVWMVKFFKNSDFPYCCAWNSF